MILSCYLHTVSIKLYQNFATAVSNIVFRALESYATGSGSKLIGHFFEIKSHCISFSQELGLEQHLRLAQNG